MPDVGAAKGTACGTHTCPKARVLTGDVYLPFGDDGSKGHGAGPADVFIAVSVLARLGAGGEEAYSE
jgi:hypothetical protein